MKGYKCKNCSFKTGNKKDIVQHYKDNHPRVYARYESNDDFLTTFVAMELLTDFGSGSSYDGGSSSSDYSSPSSDSGSSSSYDSGSSSSYDSGSSGGFDSGSGGSW